MKDFFNFIRSLTGVLIALFLAACVTSNLGNPGDAYEVIREGTPFYSRGPQQGRPDNYLDLKTYVILVRKEMGYSLVRLEDERTGYVANEDLGPTAIRPVPSSGDNQDAEGSVSAPSGSSRGKRYHGRQVNDTPLPNLPPPDLNVAPEEFIPADEPLVPSATPTPPKPTFRY